MLSRGFHILGFLAFIYSVSAQKVPKIPDDCGECDQSLCPTKKEGECVAGIIRDRCGCCPICAQREGAYCDLPNKPYQNGKCGEYLECKALDQDSEVGVCVCKYRETFCGTNGVTYNSICQLREDQYKTKDMELKIRNTGPCPGAPRILTGPENVYNLTGDDVVLICEGTGYPIPYLGWLYTRADGETFSLPGDDMSISIVSRGGPEKMQVTGWLQISEASKHHEGDYTCIAQTKYGTDQKTARIKILEREKELNRVKRKEDQL